MSDSVERVALVCPACSQEQETVHEVLSPGGQATVRCTECDHVHKEALPNDETVERDVVVSQSGDSFTARTDVDPEESIAEGDEFVLETDEGIFTVRVTNVELDGDRRVEEATAEEASTIWTRAVGNVAVKVTVHPSDGSRENTYSTTVHVPGDYEFVVGESDSFGEEAFGIEGIAVRDDASGYDYEKLNYDGDEAVAKDVKRVYARDETSDAWSAW
ncbi:HVO_0476 family zinc finger protein [Salinarchaeum chitinilyticum]